MVAPYRGGISCPNVTAGAVLTMIRPTAFRLGQFLAGLIAATAMLAAAAQAQERIALVIGNGQYVNANALPNPVSDAHLMAKTLREIGFDVSEGFDLDRVAMERLVQTFLRKATKARTALLFY